MSDGNDTTQDFDDQPEKKSKTRRKQEMEELKRMGEKLLELPEEQIQTLDYPDLIDALHEYKRISKGNARKRQLQYIGRLMRSADIDQVRELIDRFDTSSKAHTMQFHKLERWRSELIAGNKDVMGEIIAEYPHIDRQHLNQLTRNAIREQQRGDEPPVHFRKLFQYLKTASS